MSNTNWFDIFIFCFHLAAALGITGGVWLRCDPDLWKTDLFVDTYEIQNGSAGLWWDTRENGDISKCSLANSSLDKQCFALDLPLYEKKLGYIGWQLFALLGNFEWISSAFAFYYIRWSGSKHNWWISSIMVCLGTLIFMPWRGSTVYVNQIILQLLNMIACIFVFRVYNHVIDSDWLDNSGNVADQSAAKLISEGSTDQAMNFKAKSLLIPTKLTHAHLPALRYAEYCITASELWVAVFSVYVQDAPAFMSLGGYLLIFLTNLYGMLLHYSLITDNAESKLGISMKIPSVLVMKSASGVRRGLRVPWSMLSTDPDRQFYYTAMEKDEQQLWGAYITSTTSTLLNSWLAYVVAMGIIFYQQTFLFSSEPPAFVVFAGWSLIVSYTSFGIWMSIVYCYPWLATRVCCCVKKDIYEIALYGLDVLSLSSKLSIVGSLAYGFIFRAEGRC